MPKTYSDQAKSTAASARLIGEHSLAVKAGDGPLFDGAAIQAPMRLCVYRNPASNPAPITILSVTGRTGDELKISGTDGEYEDADVEIGDIVANVPIAADFTELWEYVGGLEEYVLDLEEAIEDIELTPGPPGSVWREGSGPPSDATGIDGDYYLDGGTGNVYQRAAGAYSVVANIKGATGATGPTGPAFSTPTSGILKGTGTSIVAATAGVDYVVPSGLAGYIDQTSAQSMTGVKTFAAATTVIGTTTITTTGTGASGTTVLSTTGGSITFEQTGDTFGTSRFTLFNRNGANGPIFETTSTTVSLIDMGFRVNPGGTPLTRTMRFEGRSANCYTGGAELQIGLAGQTLAALIVGDSSVIVKGGLTIYSTADAPPSAPLATLDVRGGVRLKRTVVTATPFAVTGVMYYICVTGPASARVVNIPVNFVPTGQVWIFKDEAGDAATNNITLTPASPATIDGATTLVMNQNYQSVRIYYAGSNKFFTF